jgi:hypothetical protein
MLMIVKGINKKTDCYFHNSRVWFQEVSFESHVLTIQGYIFWCILSSLIGEKILIETLQKAEQQKITDCLSSLDDIISAQAEKIEALKLHKKGLMQGLFPRMGEKRIEE